MDMGGRFRRFGKRNLRFPRPPRAVAAPEKIEFQCHDGADVKTFLVGAIVGRRAQGGRAGGRELRAPRGARQCPGPSAHTAREARS